jgi:hypothetical protein
MKGMGRFILGMRDRRLAHGRKPQALDSFSAIYSSLLGSGYAWLGSTLFTLRGFLPAFRRLQCPRILIPRTAIGGRIRFGRGTPEPPEFVRCITRVSLATRQKLPIAF